MYSKLSHQQPGVLLRGYQLSVVFQKSFSFFYPFFKPLQISFKFKFTFVLKCNSPYKND